jgi:hypothetical protein
MPIYGVYGGEKKDYKKFKSALRGLTDIIFWDEPDTDIKWRFSDESIMYWYRNLGKNLKFDILHTVEYDLVLLGSMEELYKYSDGDRHIYITALVELDKIIHRSNWFNNPEFPVTECKRLVKIFNEKYGLKKLYSCMAPGTTLTREYLEGYDTVDIPLIGFDEIRLPNIAQILEIPIKTSDFVRDWFDRTTINFRLFNTNNHIVDIKELYQTYSTGYQKAFHHVHGFVDFNKIKKLTEKLNNNEQN